MLGGIKLEEVLNDIRFYARVVQKLEKSEDSEAEGALRYYKSRLDEAIRRYVLEEDVA